MDDLKQIIARNISDLRKTLQLTQAELAEKLNYSDKAISKWERGESIPDVAVLKQIADMFGVTVDYLLEAEHTVEEIKQILPDKHHKRNQLIITLLSVALVWLIATIVFVIVGIYTNNVEKFWIIYIYALPVTFVVLLVFNSIWGYPKLNYLFITLLVWSILASVYISLLPYKIWLIFIIGIPAQIIIFLWSGFKFEKPKKIITAVNENHGNDL
ncbi:MAG: hypothetical protein A2Y17_02225 [Clostridiales bacterium GWF2_38_85]|nr:MAG: hypothetical protein A2Y17_02225 [Clostridiales bacterium GWF2_38_85]HBL85016.1 hypothetical protein [Clostridiales bacterium]